MGTSTTPSSSKVCVFCGQDVSSKPRVKDNKGHYACPDCAERAKAKQVAAPAHAPAPAPAANVLAPEISRSVMDELLDGAVQVAGKACPECGTYQKPGAVLCPNCGFNANTGKHLKTQVVRAPKEKSSPGSKRRGSGMTDLSPMAFFFIILTLIAGTAFAGTLIGGSMALLGPVAAFVFSLVVQVLVVIDAFRSGHSGPGLIMLAGLIIPGVGLYWFYYIFLVCENAAIKAMFWAALLGGAVAWGVLVANGRAEDVLQQLQN